jgi:hypothetical protein
MLLANYWPPCYNPFTGLSFSLDGGFEPPSNRLRQQHHAGTPRGVKFLDSYSTFSTRTYVLSSECTQNQCPLRVISISQSQSPQFPQQQNATTTATRKRQRRYFRHKWHKWHKKRCAIAEIAAICAIPVIFRNTYKLLPYQSLRPTRLTFNFQLSTFNF